MTMVEGRNRNVIVAVSLLLILTVGFAGCLQEPPVGDQGQTEHERDIDPRPGSGKIDIVSEREVNGSGFYLNGTVFFELYVQEAEPFGGVMMCFYDQNGTVLDSENLGTFTAPEDNASFSLHSQRVPKYIVVDHPRFRDFGGLSPETFVLLEDDDTPSFSHRSAYLEDVQDNFNYPRTEEVGVCA